MNKERTEKGNERAWEEVLKVEAKSKGKRRKEGKESPEGREEERVTCLSNRLLKSEIKIFFLSVTVHGNFTRVK